MLAAPNRRKNALSVENLSFSFSEAGPTADLFVVRHFNLTLQRGESVAILGPSGCGKTTVLDLVAGYRDPTEGRIVRGWTGRPGYMFQNYPFLPARSASAHLAFPLKARGLADDRQIHDTVFARLAEFGLASFGEYPLAALSEGMRARVALATVLMLDPPFLILDEPFRTLDVDTRLQVWEAFVNRTRKSGATTLLVTHDLSEALCLADRVVVLSRAPTRPLRSFKVVRSHDLPLREFLTSNSFSTQLAALTSLFDSTLS